MPATSALTLLEALAAAPEVLLTGPGSPDGDSIGACLALARGLRTRGARVTVAGAPGWRYDWLPDVDSMVAAPIGSWHTVVILDGDRHRMCPATEAAFHAAQRRAIIDHHASTQPGEYDLAWVEPGATSTCEMIYAGLKAWGVPLDLDTATLLHVGSLFDTGCFRYDNTTPATLAMAAELIGMGVDHAGLATRILYAQRWQGLQIGARVSASAQRLLQGQLIIGQIPLALMHEIGAVKDDLEGLVESLADVVGAQVGALFMEQEGGGTKVSLRSRGPVDVCAVAQRLSPSGGGHHKAAGVRCGLDLHAAIQAVEHAVAEQLS